MSETISNTKQHGPSSNPLITIKKYANRRLYNTATSNYVTLEHLAQMVRDHMDFIVLDAKSNEDITRSILTQIILEAESSGNRLLPVGFLRDIIRAYEDNIQGYLPSYLDLAMKSFADSREYFAKSLTQQTDLSTPVDFFQKALRANMAMMTDAARAFSPIKRAMSRDEETPLSKPVADDLAAMREQMAVMQARLDKLDGKSPSTK